MPLDAMTDQSDDALLLAYVQGDQAAARILTLRLTPRVLGQAMRMLQNRAEAEDVTQEALMRLWKIAPKWETGQAQISTWLWQVTANLCTDRLRRKGRSQPLEAAGDPADDSASAADQIQQATRVAALQAALATLPDRQAQAVRLRHIEGLGNPEIADILETSVEAVESLTARGCRALKAALAKRRDELGFSDDT